MLSKSQIKLINSLRQKKYRIKHNLFIAEGVKVVGELLNSTIECEYLVAVNGYKPEKNVTVIEVTDSVLQKISVLKSSNKVLGVFKIPKQKPVEATGLIVALDEVNDPGNLGTIIRLCDWFGVTSLVCSTNTVDCFNAKVVQSTMGSLARVTIAYTNLHDFLNSTDLPIYGAVMNGSNVHKTKLNKNAILVMGNEANGITPQLEKLITNAITIPRYGTLQKTESLNVATATAILLNEFKRE